MTIIDMRITAEQVPPQDVITRDNVSVKVNAVICFRVLQADRAFLQVTDFLFATSQFAQTTLRSVLGQVGSTTSSASATRSTASCRRSSTGTPSPGA